MPENLGERLVSATDSPSAIAYNDSGAPTDAPAAGTLPIGIDTDGPDLYIWDGDSWVLVAAAA